MKAPRGPYRVVDGEVVNAVGAIVYDYLDSPQQARDICRLLNEGVGPDWDAVRPKLEALVAARTEKRTRRLIP